MILTEKEHLRLAALMDQSARRKGLSQEQREGYLRKASRFRLLARLAREQAQDGNANRKVRHPNLRLVKGSRSRTSTTSADWDKMPSD
jgi:hypothetical protein